MINAYVPLVQGALDSLRQASHNRLPKVRVMNTFAGEAVTIKKPMLDDDSPDVLLFPLHVKASAGPGPGDHWVLFVCEPKARTYFVVDSLKREGAVPAHYVAKACEAAQRWTGNDIVAKWLVLLRGGPVQDNAHDCGVIVCACLYNYARFYSTQAFKFQWSGDSGAYYRRLLACQLVAQDIYIESCATALAAGPKDGAAARA